MKILFLLLFPVLLQAQVLAPEIVFQQPYSALPFETRVTSSGIYGLSSFAVSSDGIQVRSFDSPTVFVYQNNVLSARLTGNPGTYDISLTNMESAINAETVLKQVYSAASTTFYCLDGALTNKSGEDICVEVPDRSTLRVNTHLAAMNSQIKVNFPGNLAAADLIGIDKNGNTFILVETYVQEIPLIIERMVYTFDSQGVQKSRLALPDVKYLFTVRDLFIDEQGNLFHLYSDKTGVTIFRWSGLVQQRESVIRYPEKYCYHLHYNECIPQNEPKVAPYIPEKAASSRAQAMKIAETYVLARYVCQAANLAVNDVQAPDGDTVRTPPRLTIGANAKVAYKWGGFNTISDYNSGLSLGRYAGDINCNDVSSYAVGVDCSGFVSRCWQLTSHVVTSSMPNVTTALATWDSLRPADAVHRVGHVRMFIQKNSNGSLKVVESSGRDWGVSYWSYMPSDLTTYAPRSYNSMVTDYSFNRPELLSAVSVSSNGVRLTWNCDTTNVLGYRLYYSKDGGANWTVLMDENTLKSTAVSLAYVNDARYYRVTSVMNNAAKTESNWSNVLGVVNRPGKQKVLIIDGFDRELGYWRGAGHTFAMLYSRAIEGKIVTIECIRHKQIGSVNLSDYSEVYWIAGDQSTADETVNSTEQNLLKAYLEAGGSLFISGAEIAWDLDYKGNTADKAFFANYLKAKYISDNAGSTIAQGQAMSALQGLTTQFAQVYEVPYPDEIDCNAGSTVMLRYDNQKIAGIQYAGNFGASLLTGKVIYIAFPVETIADESKFNSLISKSYDYLANPSSVIKYSNVIKEFALQQNYPNPFNPSTTISFSVASPGNVQLTVYDIGGRTVAKLVNQSLQAGQYQVQFNASGLASGTYIYRLESAGQTLVKKLMLVK
ncbi:MAG: T9SS type A sorting domain-containing protein [Ignavibacteria bacterium]|nr:T9SS type A sorting domain-containing protein [Ignavibacteria bacterium]